MWKKMGRIGQKLGFGKHLWKKLAMEEQTGQKL